MVGRAQLRSFERPGFVACPALGAPGRSCPRPDPLAYLGGAGVGRGRGSSATYVGAGQTSLARLVPRPTHPHPCFPPPRTAAATLKNSEPDARAKGYPDFLSADATVGVATHNPARFDLSNKPVSTLVSKILETPQNLSERPATIL